MIIMLAKFLKAKAKDKTPGKKVTSIIIQTLVQDTTSNKFELKFLFMRKYKEAKVI